VFVAIELINTCAPQFEFIVVNNQTMTSEFHKAMQQQY